LYFLVIFKYQLDIQIRYLKGKNAAVKRLDAAKLATRNGFLRGIAIIKILFGFEVVFPAGGARTDLIQPRFTDLTWPNDIRIVIITIGCWNVERRRIELCG
jgi:hypothetical protein